MAMKQPTDSQRLRAEYAEQFKNDPTHTEPGYLLWLEAQVIQLRVALERFAEICEGA